MPMLLNRTARPPVLQLIGKTPLMARRMAKEFGLSVGPSSGANVVASLRVASRLKPDSAVVTILCDNGDRYYSTNLFAG